MKKTLVIALLLMLVLSLPAIAGPEIKVRVDGAAVSFPDQKPQLNADDRTLVPVRFISEQLGAEVGWNDSQQLVTIIKTGMTVKLRVGEQRAIINGQEKQFDTRAVLTNNRTMVPLRFISEAFGAEVSWDQLTNTVNITTVAPDLQLINFY